MLYISFYFLIFISSLYNIITRKTNGFFCYLIAILLTLLAGLRSSDVGFDYQQYISIIKHISLSPSILDSIIVNIRYEPLFVLISYFFSLLSSQNFIFIFIIFSFLGVFCKVILFKKYSYIPFLSLLLYFISFYFSGDLAQIRQSVAITFFLISIIYLEKNKIFISFVFIIISILFHYSSLINLLTFSLYFLYKKLTINSNFYFLLLALIISVLYSFINIKLSFYLSHIIPIEVISNKLTNYANSDYAVPLGFSISDLTRIITCILIYTLILPKNKNKNLILLFSWLYILGCILYFILKSEGIFASRLTSYYKILDCFIIPYITYVLINKTKGKENKILIFLMVSILIFIYSFLSIYKNVLTIDEYQQYIMAI
ncbi:EpsG family protein [Proteus mirabilis]|uniref:EpsG family protein n=1 Tax=Proteus mirabilis TaxID=584 RepID=UPI00177E4284|nr:EpsG family protein [Proteus mirabilis]ELN4247222.1 EpsG family protein [Proteus mirabilis]ELN4571111.1 EpsG family protein [Proteus mirabilis]HEK0328509.1 EpsG family protein [Proteus mirabilis]HEK2021005.1 EpsG family protein [Proteus mirabilis]